MQTSVEFSKSVTIVSYKQTLNFLLHNLYNHEYTSSDSLNTVLDNSSTFYVYDLLKNCKFKATI
jgi:hypothetical protein